MTLLPDYPLMAQMAVTLSGFTALVETAHRKEQKPVSARERLHIALIVAASAYVIVLGFVPSALSLLPIEPDQVWYAAIIVLVVAHFSSWMVFGYYSTAGSLVVRELRGIERAICIAFWPFGLAGIVAELAIVFGHFTAYSAFVFECVLLLFLLIGLYSFLSLLLNRN